MVVGSEVWSQRDGHIIRLLVVDDNGPLCATLASVLGTFDGIQVVGTAGNGQVAVQLCDELHPDVVLMDIMMPVMDGITATRLIKQRCSQVRIVTLSNGIAAEYKQAALEAGVFRCLSKTASVQEIVDAIHAANASSD